MNRCLIAAVMTLGAAGCAAGVEDPLPTPAPTRPQKAPPAQTFSETADDEPQVGDTDDPVANLPPRQKVPVPGLRTLAD